MSKTKAIWSFEAKDLDETLLQRVAKNGCSGIRIIVADSFVDAISKFCKKLKAQRADIPILLDISYVAVGELSPEVGQKTVQVGERFSLGPAKTGSSKQHLQMNQGQEIPSLRVGDLGFFGLNQAAFRVLDSNEKDVSIEIICEGAAQSGVGVLTFGASTLGALGSKVYSLIKEVNPECLVVPGGFSLEAKESLQEKIGESTPWFIYRVDSIKTKEWLVEHIELSDGSLLDRRAMALSMEPAYVPILCKEMLLTMHQSSKPVFVASDILASMQQHPTPTRAEVSDIANAVIDHVDAIILSEGLASSDHLEKAMQVCGDTIQDIESSFAAESFNWERQKITVRDDLEVVSYQAYCTAKRMNAKAIVCLTREGLTALRLATFGLEFPLYAFTFDPGVERKLNLLRGVESFFLKTDPKLDEVIPTINHVLKEKAGLSVGDEFVFVSISLSSMGYTASNLFTIQKIH